MTDTVWVIVREMNDEGKTICSIWGSKEGAEAELEALREEERRASYRVQYYVEPWAVL